MAEVPLEIMANPDKVLGIDISKYNGDIDLYKARTAGAKFVIARCGGGYLDSGKPFTDDLWLVNLDKLCTQEDLPWGVYWYFIPNNVTEQIAKLISLVINTEFWIPVSLDCEKWWTITAQEIEVARVNHLSLKQRARLAMSKPALSPAGASDALELALEMLDSAGIKSQVIYTRKSFWDVYYDPRGRFSECDLWAAHWDTDNPAIPRGWSTYQFHQFSGDGNGRGSEFGSGPGAGGDSDIDLDYFNGNDQAFREYLGLDLDIYPYLVRVSQALNSIIREYPGAGRYMGVVALNDLLGVYEREEAADGSVWLRIGVSQWIREGHTIRL